MTKVELKLIDANVKAQLQQKEVGPLFIVGLPGTGKTSSIVTLANTNNINILVVSAPTLTVEVLTGLPHDNIVDTNQGKKTVVSWSVPEIIAQANKLSEDKDTILLIDDFHATPKHIQAYFFKLLLGRSIGSHKLEDNIAILGTMNNSEEAGFYGINSAIRNRLAVLDVKFNFDYWFKNYGNGLHYIIKSFLTLYKSSVQEEENTSLEGYATARSWTYFSNMLKELDDEFIKVNIVKLAKMYISTDMAYKLEQHTIYMDQFDFKYKVETREDIDLESIDQMQKMMFSYILNFIDTVQDAKYLLEIMSKNSKDDAFIGFIVGELYSIYLSDKYSDGIRFMVDTLLDFKIIKSNYPNTSTAVLNTVKKVKFKNLNSAMEIATNFIL